MALACAGVVKRSTPNKGISLNCFFKQMTPTRSTCFDVGETAPLNIAALLAPPSSVLTKLASARSFINRAQIGL